MTHLKQQNHLVSSSTPLGRGCNRSHYIHGPVEYQKKPSDFCCFRCVIEQWALTVIKLLRFFCINICCFGTRFYFFLYHSGTIIQVSSKLWMFLISTPRKTKTFAVRLAVTTNNKGNGFAADVLLGLKSRPNRSHRKRSYSTSNIGNMMACDHPSCVPVGPLAFRIFSNNDRPPF